MTKQWRYANNYNWVEPHRREELIRRMLAGEKLVDAALEVGINYGNAKCIMRTYRCSSKNLYVRQRRQRTPRLLKLFAVEKCH